MRLDLPAAEATPADVARHLKHLGVARPLVVSWSQFLMTCDQCQYAPDANGHRSTLPADAMKLITTLEADPCVAR